MWFRLYLPMFQFNVGLFTLMSIDSLMVLACSWSSLPVMLKLSSVIVSPVHCMCLWMGEGCFRHSFLLSPRVLAVSQVIALVTVYDTTFVVLGVLVLRLHEYLFDGGVALEVNLYTILITYLFDTSGYSFCIGYDYLSYCGFVTTSGSARVVALMLLCFGQLFLSLVCAVVTGFLLLLLGLIEWLLFVSSQLLLNTLCCTLLIAQLGYLHFPSALLKWFISLWSVSGSV